MLDILFAALQNLFFGVLFAVFIGTALLVFALAYATVKDYNAARQLGMTMTEFYTLINKENRYELR